jgi:hypothetical protein
MDITTKTVVELKALAYDELSKIDTAQKNLSLISAEINRRIKEEAK